MSSSMRLSLMISHMLALILLILFGNHLYLVWLLTIPIRILNWLVLNWSTIWISYCNMIQSKEVGNHMLVAAILEAILDFLADPAIKPNHSHHKCVPRPSKCTNRHQNYLPGCSRNKDMAHIVFWDILGFLLILWGRPNIHSPKLYNICPIAVINGSFCW